jgi:hypothetical protein
LTKKGSSGVSDFLDLVQDGSNTATKGIKAAKDGTNLRLSKRKIDNMSKDELSSLVGKQAHIKSGLNVADNAMKGVSEVAKLARSASKNIEDADHRKKAMEKVSRMSDDELRRNVERLDLERQYSNMNSKTSKRGFEVTSDILGVVGSVAVIASAGIGIATGIKKLME